MLLRHSQENLLFCLKEKQEVLPGPEILFNMIVTYLIKTHIYILDISATSILGYVWIFEADQRLEVKLSHIILSPFNQTMLTDLFISL